MSSGIPTAAGSLPTYALRCSAPPRLHARSRTRDASAGDEARRTASASFGHPGTCRPRRSDRRRVDHCRSVRRAPRSRLGTRREHVAAVVDAAWQIAHHPPVAELRLAIETLWRACGYGASPKPRDLGAAQDAITRLPSIDAKNARRRQEEHCAARDRRCGDARRSGRRQLAEDSGEGERRAPPVHARSRGVPARAQGSGAGGAAARAHARRDESGVGGDPTGDRRGRGVRAPAAARASGRRRGCCASWPRPHWRRRPSIASTTTRCPTPPFCSRACARKASLTRPWRRRARDSGPPPTRAGTAARLTPRRVSGVATRSTGHSCFYFCRAGTRCGGAGRGRCRSFCRCIFQNTGWWLYSWRPHQLSRRHRFTRHLNQLLRSTCGRLSLRSG